MEHRPGLQGLRGVAILLVLAHHALLLPGGWIGVDLFFALSGYLISGLLLAEWERSGTIRLGAFFWRRARRLLPALALLLAVAAIASGSLAPFGFAFVADAHLAGGGAAPRGLDLLWSLALEQHFYLLWPLVLLLTLRGGPRFAAFTAGLLGVGSLILALALADHGLARVYYGPDTHATALMFGSAAGLLKARIRSDVTLVAALALLAFAAAFADRGQYFVSWMAVTAVASVVAVVSGAQLRFPAPLRRLGDYSYSLYLWHLLLLTAFGWLGLLAAFPVAALSYHLVELPIRRRRLPRLHPAVQTWLLPRVDELRHFGRAERAVPYGDFADGAVEEVPQHA